MDKKEKLTTKKKVNKIFLDTPYPKGWPSLHSESKISVISEIKGLLSNYFDLTMKTRKFCLKRRAIYKNYLLLGINSVTKSLEKDQLAAIIICAPVSRVHFAYHLFPLCASRGVAAVWVKDVESFFNTLVLSVIGITRLAESPESPVYKILEVLKENTMPLPMPLQHFQIEAVSSGEPDVTPVSDSATKNCSVTYCTENYMIDKNTDYVDVPSIIPINKLSLVCYKDINFPSYRLPEKLDTFTIKISDDTNSSTNKRHYEETDDKIESEECDVQPYLLPPNMKCVFSSARTKRHLKYRNENKSLK